MMQRAAPVIPEETRARREHGEAPGSPRTGIVRPRLGEEIEEGFWPNFHESLLAYFHSDLTFWNRGSSASMF